MTLVCLRKRAALDVFQRPWLSDAVVSGIHRRRQTVQDALDCEVQPGRTN